MTSSVKLYSAWFCPFAQRAWIALLEKGIDFEYIEVDPYNKTPEFLKACPAGLVPSIVHNGRPVYESLVCVEYVDETFTEGPKLLPTDTYERAMSRIWIDFISKRIIPTFYIILQRQDKAEQEAAKIQFLDYLEKFTKAMSEEGPYFMGKDFGSVDIALVPFTILTQKVLSHYRGFKIPKNGVFARLHAFMDAAHVRGSVKATEPADGQRLIEIYKRYADNTATSQVAEAIKKGAALP